MNLLGRLGDKGVCCPTKSSKFLVARGAGEDTAVVAKPHSNSAPLPTCCVTSDMPLASLGFSLITNHRAERLQERVGRDKPQGLFQFQGICGAMGSPGFQPQ